MECYRSRSIFDTIGPLFHDLFGMCLPVFFSVMLSVIKLSVGSKFPNEKLQIKFDFRHGWRFYFLRVIGICFKIRFGLFSVLSSDIKLIFDRKIFCDALQLKFYLGHGWSTFSRIYCALYFFGYFSFFSVTLSILDWNMVSKFPMRSYVHMKLDLCHSWHSFARAIAIGYG